MAAFSDSPIWQLTEEPQSDLIRFAVYGDEGLHPKSRAEYFIDPLTKSVYVRSTYEKDGQGEEGDLTLLVEEWEFLLPAFDAGKFSDG